MKTILTAAAALAALTLTAGSAIAADCFGEIMTKTSTMITRAEQKGDRTVAAEARRLSAEAQQLYDQGKRDEALVRVVRSMILVDRTPSGGQ